MANPYEAPRDRGGKPQRSRTVSGVLVAILLLVFPMLLGVMFFSTSDVPEKVPVVVPGGLEGDAPLEAGSGVN